MLDWHRNLGRLRTPDYLFERQSLRHQYWPTHTVRWRDQPYVQALSFQHSHRHHYHRVRGPSMRQGGRPRHSQPCIPYESDDVWRALRMILLAKACTSPVHLATKRRVQRGLDCSYLLCHQTPRHWLLVQQSLVSCRRRVFVRCHCDRPKRLGHLNTHEDDARLRLLKARRVNFQVPKKHVQFFGCQKPRAQHVGLLPKQSQHCLVSTC